MADVKSGDIVVPGEQLCVIEELSPSYGTYEKDGIVYAAAPGAVSMDLKERSIKVLDPDGKMKLALPVSGDILIGEVGNAYEQRAEISIVRRNGEDFHSGLVGEIHISNVTRRFVKSMHDVMRTNDIVRAKAINTHAIPTVLSVVGPELGVILAKCSRCGNHLTLTTNNNMFCLRCENRETREVANDYGQLFGLEARPDLAPRRRSYDRDDRYDRRGGGRYDSRSRGGDRRYDDRRSDRGRGRQNDRRRRN
ncbi:MAG: exosome complex RNA-binding protein Csl4 [Candidatus Thorarchaeota archaeon]|nr:exosome complex RNA-binding protein Csl4 [Candidatus Thorarchaeota archaeon]